VQDLTHTGTFFAGAAEFQNLQTIAGWTETEDPQNIYNPVTGVYTTPFTISAQITHSSMITMCRYNMR